MNILKKLPKLLILSLICFLTYTSVKSVYCDVHIVKLSDDTVIVFPTDSEFESFQSTEDYKNNVSLDRDQLIKLKKDETLESATTRILSEYRTSSAISNNAIESFNNGSIHYYENNSGKIVASDHGYAQYSGVNGSSTRQVGESSTSFMERVYGNYAGYDVAQKIANNALTSQDDQEKEKYKDYIHELQNACMSESTYALDQGKNEGLSQFYWNLVTDDNWTYGLIKTIMESDNEELKNKVRNGDLSVLSDCTELFLQTDKNGTKKDKAYETDDISAYYTAMSGHVLDRNAGYRNAGLAMGLGNAFLSVLSSATDNLAESVVNCLGRDIVVGIVQVLMRTDESIMKFCPTLDMYLSYFGGVGNVESSAVQLFNLNSLFYYLGAVLLVVIALIQLVTIIVNPDEAKTDIPHLLGRFFVCGFAIYMARHIVGAIYDFSNNVWNWCFGTSSSMVHVDADIGFKTLKLITYDYFHIDWEYAVFGVIFDCAIGIVLLKNIFMLLAECIERYIVSCLLYFTFPTAISFGVSNTTSNVLASYFRMLGTQLFMLFMNLYFILGFDVLLSKMDSWADSFYGLIFVIAYLKVAQAFDSYLSSLGLSVAHTSGRMGAELFGVGSTLLAGAMMLGRVGMSVGKGLVNGTAKGAGSLISNSAIMSGDTSARALRAFNLGENLRTGGLRGIAGGTRLGADTSSRLVNAQMGRIGLDKNENLLKRAFAGAVGGATLNSNKATSGQSLLNALGKDITSNGNVGKVQFNPLGGGASYTGSVKTDGGRTIKTGGQLGFENGQIKGGTKQSSIRPMGVTSAGTPMMGTFSLDTTARSGDSFSIKPDSVRKIGGDYKVTNAESGLGIDLSRNDKVRANTLDLASQGVGVTLTKQSPVNKMSSGLVQISRDDTKEILGYASATGDKFFEKGSITGKYTTSDFNGGTLSHLKPTAESECIAVANIKDIANNPQFRDPAFVNNFGTYVGEQGKTNYFAKHDELQADYDNNMVLYHEKAEEYLEALHTEGSSERDLYIEELKNRFEGGRDFNEYVEEQIPKDMEELEGMAFGENKQIFEDLIDQNSDFIAVSEARDACFNAVVENNKNFKHFQENFSSEDSSVAVFRDENNNLSFVEVHPTNVKEAENVSGEVVAIPLDTNRGIKGTENTVKEWDRKKVSDKPQEKKH